MADLKTGLITVSLNDAALISPGSWDEEAEEFQIGELPPSRNTLWALAGLTYPLKIEMPDGSGKGWRGRVYSIPSAVRGGVRFKVWHDPVPRSEKPLTGKMSPALQRLGDLLKTDKTATTRYMCDVFSLAGPGRVQLGEITKAVQSCLEDGLGTPTPRQALDRIRQDHTRRRNERQDKKADAAPRPPAPPEQPAGRIKKERKHRSVWEIRN